MSHTSWQTIILPLPLCHITLDSCCFTEIRENQRSLPSSVAFQAKLHTVDALGITSSEVPCSSVCKVTKYGGVLQCHFLWWVRLEAVKSTMVVLTYLLNTLQELSLLRGKGESSASKVLTMWKSAILCMDVKCACGGTRILSTGNAEKGLSRLSGHHSRPIGQLQVSWEKLSQRVMWSVIKENSTRERESHTSPPESVWDGS